MREEGRKGGREGGREGKNSRSSRKQPGIQSNCGGKEGRSGLFAQFFFLFLLLLLLLLLLLFHYDVPGGGRRIGWRRSEENEGVTHERAEGAGMGGREGGKEGWHGDRNEGREGRRVSIDKEQTRNG